MEPNYLLIMVAAIAAITSTILLILHAHRQRKQRRHKLITAITTIDDERKRIMADLHDEIGPLLSVAKMQAMHLQATIGTETESVVQTLDNLMYRMRMICNQLVPDTMLKKEFSDTVAGFISEIKKHSGLQVCLASDHGIHLSEKLQVQLYRVVQEIVNNTIKHANATVLTISVRAQAGKHLHISISDNGQGFQVEKMKNCRAGGMGMRNIFSRISMLNGIVFIDSMPGEGTKYMIVVPCDTKI